jgi:phosphatidate cytidylyltransferase
MGIPSSPHKTLGGFIGALFLAPFFYQLLRNFIPLQDYSLALICFLTFGALWGDLLFSGLKRLYHLKDFSAAIPGHGGVLDRIDSLIGVIFFYQIGRVFL